MRVLVKSTLIVLAVAVLGLIVISRTPSESENPEAATSRAAAPSFDRATAAQLEEIRFFLEDGYAIRHAYSARSEVTRGGYFVAAEIVHADADDGHYFSGGDVAIWYHTGEPNDVGQVLAVDGLADQACTCLYARDTKADLRPADARKLMSHVRSVVK